MASAKPETPSAPTAPPDNLRNLRSGRPHSDYVKLVGMLREADARVEKAERRFGSLIRFARRNDRYLPPYLQDDLWRRIRRVEEVLA